MNIGRWRIAFGRTFWAQTRGPTTIRHFLCFWFIKKAQPTDVDSKKQFPLGTPMEWGDRELRYYKAGKDIVKDEPVGVYEERVEDE